MGRLPPPESAYAPLVAFLATTHSALRICAHLYRRIFEQPWRSPPGRNDSFGSRICFGKNCGFAVATRAGRNGRLLSGRHLCLLAEATAGPGQCGKNSLAPSHSRKGEVAGAIFRTSWCPNGFYRAVHLLVSARRGQSAGRHVQNALAHFSVLQHHGFGGLFHHLYPDRIFFWKAVEAARSRAGPHGALSDTRGADCHRSGSDL